MNNDEMEIGTKIYWKPKDCQKGGSGFFIIKEMYDADSSEDSSEDSGEDSGEYTLNNSSKYSVIYVSVQMNKLKHGSGEDSVKTEFELTNKIPGKHMGFKMDHMGVIIKKPLIGSFGTIRWKSGNRYTIDLDNKELFKETPHRLVVMGNELTRIEDMPGGGRRKFKKFKTKKKKRRKSSKRRKRSKKR